MPILRAKFTVSSINHRKDSRELVLNPVYGADGTDNGQWSKYTPSGELRMTVTNPEAFDTLEVGKDYFVDLTPADETN